MGGAPQRSTRNPLGPTPGRIADKLGIHARRYPLEPRFVTAHHYCNRAPGCGVTPDRLVPAVAHGAGSAEVQLCASERILLRESSGPTCNRESELIQRRGGAATVPCNNTTAPWEWLRLSPPSVGCSWTACWRRSYRCGSWRGRCGGEVRPAAIRPRRRSRGEPARAWHCGDQPGIPGMLGRPAISPV